MAGSYKWLREVQAKGKNNNSKLSFHDSADRIISVKQTDPDTGITTSYDMRLAVVKPAKSFMPSKEHVTILEYVYSKGVIAKVLGNLSGVIAVDIETNGTQAANKDIRIVGIGIADSSNIIYFDFETNGKEVNKQVLRWLADYEEGMVGHNVFFDGAFLQRDCGIWLDWRYDTYGLYKQLASEGYPSQRWGLKDAQLQLLNWDHKGDIELDEWLVKNGHISDIKKAEKEGYVRLDDYEGKGPRWCKARKSEMYRAPAQILGYYCGLDAASTWQLLHEVFLPSIKDKNYEEVFKRYHKTFITNVRLMVSQQLSGITIDKEMLEAHHATLLQGIETHLDEFLNHPDVRPFATEKNHQVIEELGQAEPNKYKKQKLPKEPAKFKKDGTISKSYSNWQARMAEALEKGPEVTSHWMGWQHKMEEAAKTEHLNPNSSAQMQWLFYDKLNNEQLIFTPAGLPGVGASALPGFGDAGKVLKTQKDDVKEEGYVNTCLAHLTEGRIHPQFRMPGTLTCRLAGSGGLNLQQIPKSKGYLDCWKPNPGKSWIDCDHTALEQVVLAELSRDPALYSLYGPTAKANDVYLFNGAIMARDFGIKIFQPFLDAGYIPEDPDPEIIKKVKKQYKNLRGISKTASLGKSYGMGWKKFQLNMKIAGIQLSEDECRAVINGLDKVYAGVKKYEQQLLREYEANNGYVLNGMGRPVGCARDYLKDIVNRVIQSTGHDIHMLYVQICDDLFRENRIKVNGIVWDFHDQSIVECDTKDAELVYYLIGTKAYEILNDKYLQGEIRLKGDPQYINTMADAKVE
jgi:DNA polymerase I-like protein with 3'-5' exonuclease and polymerase domains